MAFPTSEDYRIGLRRIAEVARADLERLAAKQISSASRRRMAAVSADTRADAAAAALQVATTAQRREDARRPDPACESEPRSQLAHAAFIVALVGVATLEAFVNYRVFEILALTSFQTLLVVLGAQLLVTLAAHDFGARLKRITISAGTERGRRLAREFPALLTALALVAFVVSLTVVRGAVFSTDLTDPTNALSISDLQARMFFGSLTALLATVAIDVGFSYESSLARALRDGARRKRGLTRVSVSASRAEARRMRREAELRTFQARLAHERKARGAEWQSAIEAFAQGFRASAPSELVPELDEIELPHASPEDTGQDDAVPRGRKGGWAA